MWYGRKHYLENARGYLYGALTLCGLLALMIIMFEKNFVVPQTMIMGLAAVYCVQLTCRSHYDKLQRACSYTLPVTQGEKFLFMWFNTVVVSSAVIILVGLVVAWCGMLFPGFYSDFRSDLLAPLCLMFFGMQSGALFVCCWTKDSPLKGYLLILGIFLAFLMIHGWFWRYFFDLAYSLPLSWVNGWVDNTEAILMYSVGGGVSLLASYLFMGLWIPVLWVAAYFKFRERTLK